MSDDCSRHCATRLAETGPETFSLYVLYIYLFEHRHCAYGLSILLTVAVVVLLIFTAVSCLFRVLKMTIFMSPRASTSPQRNRLQLFTNPQDCGQNPSAPCAQIFRRTPTTSRAEHAEPQGNKKCKPLEPANRRPQSTGHGDRRAAVRRRIRICLCYRNLFFRVHRGIVEQQGA